MNDYIIKIPIPRISNPEPDYEKIEVFNKKFEEMLDRQLRKIACLETDKLHEYEIVAYFESAANVGLIEPAFGKRVARFFTRHMRCRR